jgi:NAD+ kinase
MKIHFTASHSIRAQQSWDEMTRLYGQADKDEADIFVSMGGDGHVMRVLYDAMDKNKPLFALRRTDSVGFLCNDFSTQNLLERLAKAQTVTLHPLRLDAVLPDGATRTAWAFNEVAVLRETTQAARLKIAVDGIERIAQYSGDGILVSTPAGSTAYNHSCGGPIMPINANTLVMTAICGYRPRGWHYAVLPCDSVVDIQVQETAKRPVKIESGTGVIRNAQRATIRMDMTKQINLMFDPDQHLGERILREQFLL